MCGICGRPDPQHVDHDHLTGYIRGVLCFTCNGGLGHFRDNVGHLHRAVDYLRATASVVPAHPGVYRVRTPRYGIRPVYQPDRKRASLTTDQASE